MLEGFTCVEPACHDLGPLILRPGRQVRQSVGRVHHSGCRPTAHDGCALILHDFAWTASVRTASDPECQVLRRVIPSQASRKPHALRQAFPTTFLDLRSNLTPVFEPRVARMASQRTVQNATKQRDSTRHGVGHGSVPGSRTGGGSSLAICCDHEATMDDTWLQPCGDWPCREINPKRLYLISPHHKTGRFCCNHFQSTLNATAGCGVRRMCPRLSQLEVFR
ncbi:hypothetical protein F4780DRAFT_3074 [Xylariomycetidae sp. FL0641]|nr:hypothetical protein F4780DRAFT_3074 [Xylariomycetidae sp. FL0641]